MLLRFTLAGGHMEGQSPLTTILLIDDDDKDRTYYAERIRMGIPHCTVLEPRDGRSGLGLYRSRRIDCLVTEVYLPDMSGLELLIEVVPRASKPALAVIILTQTVSKPLSDLAMRVGAQGFFVKRFTSGDELTQIIPKAIAWIGPMQKDRHSSEVILHENPSSRPILSSSPSGTGELRNWRRFTVELYSSVSSTGPEWSGTAVNLSRQGCAIQSRTPVQNGDHLHLLIFPGPNQTPLEVEVAQVRWVANEYFGVEFLTLAPGEAIRLDNLLAIIGKG